MSRRYIGRVDFTDARPQYLGNGTFWMRGSTGQLCVDLTPGVSPTPALCYREWISTSAGIKSFNDASSDTTVIASLELQHYHQLCLHLRHIRVLAIPAQGEVNMEAVMYWPSASSLKNSVEIAWLTEVDTYLSSWYPNTAAREITKNGWTR